MKTPETTNLEEKINDEQIQWFSQGIKRTVQNPKNQHSNWKLASTNLQHCNKTVQRNQWRLLLSINTVIKSFNFLKSLDIAAINTEIELLHPCTHEFWEEEETRAEF